MAYGCNRPCFNFGIVKLVTVCTPVSWCCYGVGGTDVSQSVICGGVTRRPAPGRSNCVILTEIFLVHRSDDSEEMVEVPSLDTCKGVNPDVVGPLSLDPMMCLVGPT